MENQSSEIDLLLKTLKSGMFPERTTAAKKLGALDQSNSIIISALMQSVKDDGDPNVRAASIAALESPSHKAFLETHPELKARVVDIIQKERKGSSGPSQQRLDKQFRIRQSQWLGIRIILVGVAALVLPMFGYELVFFKFLPVTAIGGVLIIVGIIIALFGGRGLL